MNQRAVCPACRESVAEEAVTLWDGRTYCRGCVEAVSPGLYQFAVKGGQLVDVIRPADYRVLSFCFNFGKLLLGFSFLLIFLFWGMITLAAGKAAADAPSPFLTFAFFGVGAILLLMVKSLFQYWLKHSYLPRGLKVKRGYLQIRSSDRRKRFPLQECQWYVGRTIPGDLICLGTGLKWGIIIRTPIALLSCGHSAEILPHWQAFLKLAGVPRLPEPRSNYYIPGGMRGMILGTLAGYSLGHLLSLVTGQEFWISGLLLQGAFTGALIASVWIYYSRFARQDESNTFFLAGWGITCFVVGAIIGCPGGMPAALWVGSLNMVAGLLLITFFQFRLSGARDHQPQEALP